jgi:leucyl-tRNA synthetase
VNDVYLHLDDIEDNKEVFSVIIRNIRKMFAPIAPHICEEAWSLLGFAGTLSGQTWPIYDEKFLVTAVISIPIQINGKLRGIVDVGLDDLEETVFEKALAVPAVQKALSGKPPKKKIFVKGKIVSFVV